MQRERDIFRVTILGSIVNVILTICKIIAGTLGHSAAMVADGIHSLSDLISDIVVIIVTRVASNGSNDRHHFGHGKFEALATLMISIVLVAVSLNLMIKGIGSIIDVIKGGQIPVPAYPALLAALLSLLSKEWLFQITSRVGKRSGSPVVVANALHHRSDALASAGAFIGIGVAMLFGDKWTVLDPIVSCIISVFVVVAAAKMAQPSLSELLETSLPEDIENEIKSMTTNVKGVRNVHELKTRSNGISFIIDAHIVVDPHISVACAHDIATKVERALYARYGNETQINIQVEPDVDSE
ncbi:MAG: cation diffusion facilitator family transporter [Bacteroides sp.]|nr:cation diffusion facilitator family transporter [Bacteroides sp.]MCM1446985.1 cation diffusion facilitator family transporter [Bacteroides sp.]MCM1514995.1 cation diffusion facilitator family transporter [Paraprevotella sp.]